MLRVSQRLERAAPTWFGLLLAAPAVGVLALVVLYPIGYNVVLSLSRVRVGTGLGLSFVGFDNYAALMRDPTFWVACRNTFTLAVVAVAIEMALGLAFAVLLDLDVKGTRAARGLLISPVMLAPVVVALLWRWLYADEYGVLNHLLQRLSLPAVHWLADPRAAMVSLIIADTWQTFPFVMMMLLAGLQALPVDPYDAARVDGATWWQTFRYLTLPLLRPVIRVALIIRTTDILRIFDTVYVLTGGGPGTATEVLGTLTYRETFTNLDFGKGSALSLLTLVAASAVGLGYVKLLGRGAES